MNFTALLSVYKNESADYLNLALTSIWDSQTIQPNQIVLVKDGPLTIELEEVINKWKNKLDNLLTIVPLKNNIGLAAALNEGLAHCNHELIARMDTDDIAAPNRFKVQLNFFENNPDITVCGGQIEEYSEDLQTLISIRKLPLQHDEIVQFAKKRNPISHPCVMFKKSAVLSVGGYPSIYPEDYPLWILMISRGYKFSNLPDILLKMRVGNALTSRRGLKFLKGEIKAFKLMKEIGFLNNTQYFINVSQRTILRLSPSWFKKLLYKFVR